MSLHARIPFHRYRGIHEGQANPRTYAPILEQPASKV